MFFGCSVFVPEKNVKKAASHQSAALFMVPISIIAQAVQKAHQGTTFLAKLLVGPCILYPIQEMNIAHHSTRIHIIHHDFILFHISCFFSTMKLDVFQYCMKSGHNSNSLRPRCSMDVTDDVNWSIEKLVHQLGLDHCASKNSKSKHSETNGETNGCNPEISRNQSYESMKSETLLI